jgi:thiamine pyrophosphokinase
LRTVVVVAGGGPLDVAAAGLVPAEAIVIGADGGAHAAHAAGLRVHHAVGDFDSIAPDELEELQLAGAEIHRHPRDKDATDLELAMELAVGVGGDRLIVLGAWGDRLDHLAGELALLASDRWSGVEVEARLGAAQVHVIRRSLSLVGSAGELLTLLAVGGHATGVRTTGLRFSLSGDTLVPGSTLGVSNELLGGPATVSVETGVVVAIRPYPGSP